MATASSEAVVTAERMLKAADKQDIGAIRVTRIQKGDQMRYDDGEVLWEATANARPHKDKRHWVTVPVRWGDGSKGERSWPDLDAIPVHR